MARVASTFVAFRSVVACLCAVQTVDERPNAQLCNECVGCGHTASQPDHPPSNDKAV